MYLHYTLCPIQVKKKKKILGPYLQTALSQGKTVLNFLNAIKFTPDTEKDQHSSSDTELKCQLLWTLKAAQLRTPDRLQQVAGGRGHCGRAWRECGPGLWLSSSSTRPSRRRPFQSSDTAVTCFQYLESRVDISLCF